MTTPEGEKRVRSMLWILVILIIAVVAAYLVFLWLDDDESVAGALVLIGAAS